MKDNEMGGKTLRKEKLGKPWHRGKYNVKVYFTDTGWGQQDASGSG
jgi:hypothetical protein